MSKNRPLLIGLVVGVVVLCLCLVCGGAGAAYYFLYPQSVTVSPTSGEFSGYFTAGFEVSSFVPCSGSEIGGDAGPWWTGGTPESGFYDRYLDVIGATGPEYVTVYVRWRGTVSPLGTYGHMGEYTREATVEEVLEMRLNGTC
jgi:hypothetical protein